MKEYELAIFIGRFQPFHRGHLWELERALEVADKVVVGIGSSNVSDTNNPYSYEKRKLMIEKVIESDTSLYKSIVNIFPIPDTPSDSEWVRGVVSRIKYYVLGGEKGEVVVVGNNEWVNGLMEKGGYAVLRTGFFNRDELEGVKIRAMIAAGDERWRERVPRAVSAVLAQSTS